jgi:hypothetical protein
MAGISPADNHVDAELDLGLLEKPDSSHGLTVCSLSAHHRIMHLLIKRGERGENGDIFILELFNGRGVNRRQI